MLELSSFQLHSINIRPDVAVDHQRLAEPPRQAPHLRGLYRRQAAHLSSTSAPATCSSSTAITASPRASARRQGAASCVLPPRDGAGRRLLPRRHDILLPRLGGRAHHPRGRDTAARRAQRGELHGRLRRRGRLVSPEMCRAVARSYGGVRHRLELIRKLDGVSYINDSIATSPTRTIAGLRAMRVKPVLIAGGPRQARLLRQAGRRDSRARQGPLPHRRHRRGRSPPR